MAACSAPISSRSLTIRCRASTMSGTWPTSPRPRRAGRKARAASASFGSRIEYETQKFWKRQLGRTRLNIDIVDYPGEWLLDLPLLRLDYARMVADGARAERRAASRRAAAKDWHAALAEIDPARARRRDAGRETCRSVQGLFARHPRRRSRAIDAAAWALPHAWRSRRLAGAHLRAARSRRARRVSRAARSSP